MRKSDKQKKPILGSVNKLRFIVAREIKGSQFNDLLHKYPFKVLVIDLKFLINPKYKSVTKKTTRLSIKSTTK